MDSSIRTTLWGAFAALVILIASGLAVAVGILQIANRQDYRVVEGSAPLLNAVHAIDDDTETLLSAARAYALTGQTVFLGNYDQAVRDFEKSSVLAVQLAINPRDAQIVSAMRRHFQELKQLTDREIELVKAGQPANANEVLIEAARIRRATPDYSGTLSQEHERLNHAELRRITGMRNGLTLLAVVVSLAVIILAATMISRVQRSLAASINRQVRRTEAMIAGMSDGVVLVDGEGRTAFLNPAAQQLLGRSEVGVPIDQHAEVYRLRDENGNPIDAKELPSAKAISAGKPVRDVTMIIAREDRQVAVSMSATPLQEDGRISGVVVTFRDVTER